MLRTAGGGRDDGDDALLHPQFKNKGHVAHHAHFSLVVTAGKEQVLEPEEVLEVMMIWIGVLILNINKSKKKGEKKEKREKKERDLF